MGVDKSICAHIYTLAYHLWEFTGPWKAPHTLQIQKSWARQLVVQLHTCAVHVCSTVDLEPEKACAIQKSLAGAGILG